MKELLIISSKNEWQDVLKQVENYDFYHTYDYHNLSKDENENPILIKYTEGDILIALPLLIRKIPSSEYFDATSVYGYSGPLQLNVNSSFNNYNFIKALHAYLKKEKIISVFSRLNPFMINQETIINNLGDVIDLGKIVNIDLTKNIDDQRTLFSRTTKRYINKNRRLCDIKTSRNEEDINTFIDLYYENMDRVNAKKKYYFSKKYFHDFIHTQDFQTDVLFAIEKESKKIISAAMMVKTNNIIQYHISGTRNDYLKLSPIRFLIDEMRIKGSLDNYTYFNLGGGIGNQDDELFRFKSAFSKDFKTFKVWKYIVNSEVYQQLVDEKEIKSTSDYFPLYRNE